MNRSSLTGDFCRGRFPVLNLWLMVKPGRNVVKPISMSRAWRCHERVAAPVTADLDGYGRQDTSRHSAKQHYGNQVPCAG